MYPLQEVAETPVETTASDSQAAPTMGERLQDAVEDPQSALTDFGNYILEVIVEHGPKLLVAAATFVIGRWIVGLVTRTIRKVLERNELDPTLIGFLCNIIRMGLLTLVLVAAINELGVNTTSFAAIIGAAGLAVAFALQGSLGNFASGVMIIFFRPFRVGDFVEAAGVSAVVREVGVFATILTTGDNKRIIVPNSAIMNGNITNYSANPTRRVDMVFGIGYDDDLKKAKATLERILSEDERVLKDPAPVVAVSALADSSVNFHVRPWVNSADYWDVYWDMHQKVKLTFDAEGISIPFPQTDVHLHKVEGGAA